MIVVKSALKTVVIMVISRGMKRGMSIQYVKCKADLNFEVDFGVNDAIGTIATKWVLIFFG